MPDRLLETDRRKRARGFQAETGMIFLKPQEPDEPQPLPWPSASHFTMVGPSPPVSEELLKQHLSACHTIGASETFVSLCLPQPVSLPD